MPRIKSRRKIYMQKDIGSWIAGKMREKRITQKSMSEQIGISQQAFCKKIFNNQFTYSDLITILSAIDATDEEILKLMKI